MYGQNGLSNNVILTSLSAGQIYEFRITGVLTANTTAGNIRGLY